VGEAAFVALMKDAALLVLLLSAPALGVGLLQALTQIQDQTLPQAVKLVAVLLVLIVTGPLLGGEVADLAGQMLDRFPAWTR
jgi:type III secretion protein S